MRGSDIMIFSIYYVCFCLLLKTSLSDKNTPTIYVLPRIIPENATILNGTCKEIYYKCQNATEFTPLYDNGPLRPDPILFSNLIRFKRQYGNLPSPINIDDDFLTQLTLLYDNEEQLRVLLTLLRSYRQKDWMTFLGGYTGCEKSNPFIYTCINNACNQHNLLKLNYTNDLFSENVIGFDLYPPFLFVLVLIRNNKTQAEAVIRIPTTSISVLDATYNLIRSISDITRLGTDLVNTLSYYRELFPTVFSVTDLSRQRIIRRHKHEN